MSNDDKRTATFHPDDTIGLAGVDLGLTTVFGQPKVQLYLDGAYTVLTFDQARHLAELLTRLAGPGD